jgi:Uma2 family endonuclease
VSAGPKRKLTAAEYLAIELAAPHKSEFYAGEMFAVAGGSYDHNRVKDNLAGLLHTAFSGGPCFAVTSDMKVKVSATGLYSYPDVAVVCGAPEFEPGGRDVLLNPRVVVEVLSDSTEGYDRGLKFLQYQLASLQEYVSLSQTEAVAERYVRRPDGTWVYTSVQGLAAEFAFATVPARVRLADVYDGVTFPGRPPR